MSKSARKEFGKYIRSTRQWGQLGQSIAVMSGNLQTSLTGPFVVTCVQVFNIEEKNLNCKHCDYDKQFRTKNWIWVHCCLNERQFADFLILGLLWDMLWSILMCPKLKKAKSSHQCMSVFQFTSKKAQFAKFAGQPFCRTASWCGNLVFPLRLFYLSFYWVSPSCNTCLVTVNSNKSCELAVLISADRYCRLLVGLFCGAIKVWGQQLGKFTADAINSISCHGASKQAGQ